MNLKFPIRKIFIGVIFSAIGVIHLRCNKEAQIPSYVHIDKINLTTNYPLEGSNSNKITDAWVYIDNNPAGAYEMPCTFPVLYFGTHHVKIFAGIKENGISDTRIIYPFYSIYEADITFTQGQVTKISPAVKYNSNITFQWLEDFEGAAHTICTTAGVHDTLMKITKNASEIFEGAGSGKVEITSGEYIGLSCSKYSLPQGGANVFLELNYKCNTEFAVGVYGYDAANNVVYQSTNPLFIRATDSWNKIYFNLTQQVSEATTAIKFSIYFDMLKDANLSASDLYLDNIKLIN